MRTPPGRGEAGRKWEKIKEAKGYIQCKKKRWRTTESSGITEHCNKLESHYGCSAQVALAADSLPVSLPTTAPGNSVVQHRSFWAGLRGKKKKITGFSFSEASNWDNTNPPVHSRSTEIKNRTLWANPSQQMVQHWDFSPVFFMSTHTHTHKGLVTPNSWPLSFLKNHTL